MHSLAREVVDELNIETLVRLDVRADDAGDLFVLETNPKPDLKAPTNDGVTSLISIGLSGLGMTYDDLIMSLFADRVDALMSRWRGSDHHLLSHLSQNVSRPPNDEIEYGNG